MLHSFHAWEEKCLWMKEKGDYSANHQFWSVLQLWCILGFDQICNCIYVFLVDGTLILPNHVKKESFHQITVSVNSMDHASKIIMDYLLHLTRELFESQVSLSNLMMDKLMQYVIFSNPNCGWKCGIFSRYHLLVIYNLLNFYTVINFLRMKKTIFLYCKWVHKHHNDTTYTSRSEVIRVYLTCNVIIFSYHVYIHSFKHINIIFKKQSSLIVFLLILYVRHYND